MKAYKILTTACVALLSVSGAFGQQTKILTADKHNEYGIVYSLPVTSLRVDVKAVREVRKAGPYWQYAKKFIGTDKVVREDAEVWTVESVSVTSVGIPDEEHQYLMQLKPGALTYVGVDEDGMILSINKEPEDGPAEPEAVEETAEVVYAPNEYLQYVDGDFIASQSTAKQAQMLASNLMDVRESKVALTRGTAETMPTDGRQLELMLGSLERQEGALTAAFIGNISHETVTRSFTFTPADNSRDVLFRMSGFAGFVEADDMSGEPVYIEVKVTSRGELPVDAKGEEKKWPKDGVAYCIPGAARVRVSLMGNALWEGELELSQLGTVFALNPNIFTDKKNPSYAVFDPATGALREIGVMQQ